MPINLLYDGLALVSQRIAPGNTATAIGRGVYKYTEIKLHIDSGGTVAITAGMHVLGATSGARGIVVAVGDLEGSTTWAGGDATCYLTLRYITGTFQNNELLTIDATADDATVDGTAITLDKDQYTYPQYFGLTARQLWITGETQTVRVGIDGVIPTQTSLMGIPLQAGQSIVLTDASNMAAAKVIDSVSGTTGAVYVQGLF